MENDAKLFDLLNVTMSTLSRLLIVFHARTFCSKEEIEEIFFSCSALLKHNLSSSLELLKQTIRSLFSLNYLTIIPHIKRLRKSATVEFSDIFNTIIKLENLDDKRNSEKENLVEDYLKQILNVSITVSFFQYSYVN